MILQGDCLEVLRDLPEASVTAIVTDPPYGLEFMGKGWDKVLPPVEVWRECLRVLRPGGHALIFGGTRTYHRLACAVEDAGFEVRDCLMWLYGQGFPKSLDVSKAIDKRPGMGARTLELKQWLAQAIAQSGKTQSRIDDECGFTACAFARWRPTSRPDPWRYVLPTGEKWAVMKLVIGFGSEWDSALQEATREVVGTKTSAIATPGDINRRTVGGSRSVELDVTVPASPDARLWSGYGTALKPAFEPILLARKPLIGTVERNCREHGTGALNIDECRIAAAQGDYDHPGDLTKRPMARNSFAAAEHGDLKVTQAPPNELGRWPANLILDEAAAAQLGEESRFFYCAKASKRDRGEGNTHPTVKPVELMRWLVRLVKGPGENLILDPFAGSGTTGVACQLEDVPFLLIEREAAYVAIVEARLAEK